MPTLRPRGLILDYFGVLTSNMVEVIEYFEDRERIKRGTFLRAWADPRGRELFEALELGRITQEAWNTSYAELMGVVPDDLMARYLLDAYPAHQVLKVARQARAAGIKTAVLSNSLGRTPYDPYAAVDLTGTFDAVVLSAERGVRKPDPAIFRIVLDELGLAADECVFVDDSEDNLQVAVDLGMTIVFSLDESEVARRLRMVFGLPDL